MQAFHNLCTRVCSLLLKYSHGIIKFVGAPHIGIIDSILSLCTTSYLCRDKT